LTLTPHRETNGFPSGVARLQELKILAPVTPSFQFITFLGKKTIFSSQTHLFRFLTTVSVSAGYVRFADSC